MIGLGRFGSSVAKKLHQLGNEVLAIDEDEEHVQHISQCVTHAVQADATDEDVLRSLGIKNFDVVVISIGSHMQSSILATIIVKELGIKQVVAKAQNELHAKVLSKVGADQVILPERDMGIRTAYNLNASNISMLDFISISDDYKIVKITPLEEWVGKSVGELHLRKSKGVNIITIETIDKKVNMPSPDTIIQKEDMLLVLCANKDLNRLLSIK